MHRYLIRYILLTLAFALMTMGLLGWQQVGFALNGVWPFADELQSHPLHLLVIGLALIPPTLWELFLLERANR